MHRRAGRETDRPILTVGRQGRPGRGRAALSRKADLGRQPQSFQPGDNADYQYKKNGADLGADSEDAFIAKAHDFVDHPPKGAQTLKRSNGDTLVYDAKSNVFAVVAKDGAPRTIFKPREGAAYWDQQKAEVDKPYSSYRTTARKTSAADDNG